MYQAAILKTIDGANNNQRLKLGDAFKKGFSLFGSMAWIAVVYLFRIFLWTLLPSILIVFTYVASANKMTTILQGIIIIIIFVLSILYVFANFALIIDGKKGRDALNYSRKIIKKNSLKFLGNSMVVILILACILMLCVYVVVLILGERSSGSVGLMPTIGEGLGQILFPSILGVYFSVFYYYLYGELKRGI